MALNDMWLQTNGATLAAALEAHREAIYAALAERLATTYPLLCYDPNRFDAQAFQQLAQRRSPERLHKLIQSALRLRNLGLIKTQYEWAWPLMQRFGVAREHLLVQVSWYFAVARALTTLDDSDRQALHALETNMVQIVKAATMVGVGVIGNQQMQSQSNGKHLLTKPKA